MNRFRIFLLILWLSILLIIPCACDKPDPAGPASKSRLQIFTSKSELPTGTDERSQATITAYVRDPFGEPAEKATVSFITSLGTVNPSSATVDASGHAATTFTAGNVPGKANIIAEAFIIVDQIQETLENSIEIEIYESSVYTIELSASPKEVPADGVQKATLEAIVKNERAEPIANIPVNFNSTLGTVNPASKATDTYGKAVSEISSSTAGTATVSATAGGKTASTTIVFTSTAASSIRMTVNPYRVPANGTTKSTVCAWVQDQRGVPVVNATVNFTSTCGILSANSASTDNNGMACIQISSTQACLAEIYATCGNAEGYATVEFYEDNRYQIFLSANPPDGVIADNKDYSTINAIVRKYGSSESAPNGTIVNFSIVSGVGKLSASFAQISNGQASVTVRSDTPNTVRIRGWAGSLVPGAGEGFVDVIFVRDEEIANITLSSSPRTLTVYPPDPEDPSTNHTSTITCLVTNAKGLTIADAFIQLTMTTSIADLPKLYVDKNGYIEECPGTICTAETNSNGIATFYLLAATESGNVSLYASGGGKTSNTETLIIEATLGAKISLSRSRAVCGKDETSTLTADVRDKYDNPVKDGTYVDFDLIEVTPPTAVNIVIEPSNKATYLGIAQAVVRCLSPSPVNHTAKIQAKLTTRESVKSNYVYVKFQY